MNDDLLTIEQLEHYLAGSLDQDARTAVETWLAKRPERAAELETIRAAMTQAFTAAPVFDAERARTRLQHRIATTPARPRRIATSTRPSMKWMAGLGAGLATIALVMIVQHPLSWSTSRDTTSTSIRTYTTQNGQRSIVTLADGSIVTLNVASTLEVPTDFGKTTRTVRVSGEALFAVSGNRILPFVVDAKQMRTTVLGTTFAIRAYAADANTRISVQDGRVSADGQVLEANDVLTVDARRDVRLARHQNIATAVAFSRGVLSFDGIALAKAVPDLNRWYDIDVRMGDAMIGRTPIVADLHGGDQSALRQALELGLNARVEVHGRVWTITHR